MLLYFGRDRTDNPVRGAEDVHLDFHTAPKLCKNAFSGFTSTETIRTVRDGKPRTSTLILGLTMDLHIYICDNHV